MFVRVLKKCQCTLSFWYDRNWGDQWKDDDWEKRKRQETLEAGQVIDAIKVRRSAKRPSRCQIDVNFMGDLTNRYLSVPWDCIEILKGKPKMAEPTGHR